MASALAALKDGLGAGDVAVIYGSSDGFRHFATCAELELSETSIWWVNRELSTRGRPFGFHLHDGKVRHVADLGEPVDIEYAASLIPTRGATAQMLLVRGPWAEGMSEEQAQIMRAAGPALAILVEQRINLARAEQEQEQLNAFAAISRVISETEDLETMLTRIAATISMVARINYVSIDILGPDGSVAMRCLNYGNNDQGEDQENRWKRGHTRPDPVRDEVLATGRAMVFPDAQKDERLPESGRNFFMRSLIRSTGVFPLLGKEGPLGVLSFASHRPMAFTESERQLLEGLTGQVAAAVDVVRQYDERRRAEEALRRGEELLRATLESTADGILVVDDAGRAAYVNPRFAEMWHIPRDLLDARDDARMMDYVVDQLNDPQAFVDRVQALYGTADESLDTIAFKDGRVIERYSRPLLGEDGRCGRVWSFRDVTEKQLAETAIRRSEERFRSLVQNTTDMITVVDPYGRALYVSPSVERVMGYAPDEWAVSMLSVVHPDDAVRAAVSLADLAMEPGIHPSMEVRAQHKDGSWRDIEMVGNNLLDDPSVNGIVFNARDITDRKCIEQAVRQSEERFRALVQNASDLITVIDADTAIRYQSPSIERLLGHDAGALCGTKLSDLLHPDDVARLLGFISEAMAKPHESATVEARLRHRDGSWRDVEIVGTDLRHDAAIEGFVLNARDVSERKVLEKQLRHQAFHDPLTRLANRARFTDRLEHGLQRTSRDGKALAVLFMDLDNFKSVNDGLGHSAGDRLLVEIAERVQRCLRPGDTAARFGGDEFAILLEDLTSADEATIVAERIFEALRPPFETSGKELFIRASAGIALGHGASEDADELLRNADVAMYVAKSHGKGRFELYQQTMHVSMIERLELLGDLQRAVDREEFVVHYQPVVAMESGRIVGVEALVRWQHPERGLLPPAQFIPLAEESGVILSLGRWVLNEACLRMREWQIAFPDEPPLTLSVNVSVRQIQEPAFVDEVAAALAQSGLAPNSLILEITESVMMQEVTSTVQVLQSLKDLGVRLAIDDFGTGYSSLSYLRQFPFDILKIDKSFVDAGDRVNDKELTRAIIELGRTLHMEIVAEGIEAVEQLARLRALACELGQGYYFARPVERSGIDELLSAPNRSIDAA
jgi:diguanylate cyclase (GGDEF)-like protein/PAS domain S-box-containing protein